MVQQNRENTEQIIEDEEPSQNACSRLATYLSIIKISGLQIMCWDI